MSQINLGSQKRADTLYNYKLYSFMQFRVFSKYAWKTAKDISNNYGGTRFGVWLHMMWCNIRYGAMYDRDYTLFEFYRKSCRERNLFLTFRRYFKLVKCFDKKTFYLLMNKTSMYQRYAEFIKRDWVIVDENTSKEEVERFLKDHNRVLVKPVSSEQGSGIYIVTNTDSQGLKKVLQDRLEFALILEELCVNCSELNAINESSLNTLRVYTIVNKENEVQIASTSLRCGCGDSIVDNWGAGGVGYPVDLENGVIFAPGLDKKGGKHIIHPGTSIVMPGFQIPRYQDACKMAKEIISKDKKVVYAGLDIAILPDRVELIEVNFPGGHDFLQALDQVGKYHMLKHLYKSK